MDKYETIGQGARASWPYEVAVHWPGIHPGGPISLTEGTGFCAAGGNFALTDILDDKWTTNLEVCNCLWLRDLAREEQTRGTLFTADEIWQRAQRQK